MKINNLLVALALGAPLCAVAVPAPPGILTVYNADGTPVKVRAFGNEFFNYVTDEDGVYLLERNKTGNWVKVVRNGAELMNVSADLNRLREIKTVEDLVIEAPTKSSFRYDNDLRCDFPSVGDNVHSLVVLLEYPDIPFTMDDPVAFYTRWLNEENFKYEDLTTSARDYFIESSDGKFKPSFDVKLYRLPKPHTEYTNSSWRPTLAEAIRALDSEVDYSKYDFDGDGKVDTVYFIYSGYGQADTLLEEYIWPHQASLSRQNLFLDGMSFDNYACSNSLRGGTHYTDKDNALTGIGTFCHEFSHVLGLVDYYDTTGSGTANAGNADYTPGYWSIMDVGPYLNDGRTPPLHNSFDRRVLKWLDEYEMLDEDGDYTLQPFAKKKTAYRVSLDNPYGTAKLTKEFYLIENHTKEGFDSYLPGEGMIIWHINYLQSEWVNNRPNNYADNPRITLMRPDGTEAISKSIWPNEKYSYVGMGWNNEFKTVSQNRRQTPAYVYNMKLNDDKTASFTFASESPYDSKIESIKANLVNEQNNTFNIAWPAVADAESYMVTLKRQGATREYVVAGLNNSVINATEVEFNVSAGMMPQTFTATVRPVKNGIPSTEATQASFIPENIDGPDAIEDIADENSASPIYGAEGYIVAPENAEIYTIGGIRTSNENLPAGIYIVRAGTRAVKVTVK